jgi:hypothetical protein
VLLGHVGDGVRDRRAVRPHDGVDLVLHDQLLVDANGGLRVGTVIVDYKLNWQAEDTALFVDVLLAE